MTTVTNRRSFLTSLAAAVLGAPLVARATLTLKPWSTTREEQLQHALQAQERATPEYTQVMLTWQGDPMLYESYSVCRLPEGVTAARVLQQADPTIGYPVLWTALHDHVFFTEGPNARGREYLVVGVGHDGYTTPIKHTHTSW